MKRYVFTALIVQLMMIAAAHALRTGGRSTKPLSDQDWPLGCVDLANLPSRIGYQMGDPGWTELYYKGDTAALQQAINQLAEIRWEKVDLILRDGPYHLPGGGWSPPDMAGDTPDWIFTVVDPQRWNRWRNNPTSPLLERLRAPVPAPKMVVYIDREKIDWTRISVPTTLQVADERASAAGFPAGPVIQADIYDLTTSKPIPGARLAVGVLGPQNAWTPSKEVISDIKAHAELAGFEAGQYVVAAFCNGYAPRMAESVEFRGDTYKRYSILLAPMVTVTGTVVGDSGQTLKGVTIQAYSFLAPDGSEYRLPGLSSLQAISDDAGHFSLNTVPKGFLYLNPTDPSYARSGGLGPVEAPSKGLVINMARTGSIRGKVLDQQGNPITKGLVHLFVPTEPRVGTWGGTTPSKPDGSFEFPKVPPGRYMLSDLPAEASRGQKQTEVEVKAGEATEVELRW